MWDKGNPWDSPVFHWDETGHGDLSHKRGNKGNPRDSLVSHWDFGMRQDIGISITSVGLKGIPCVPWDFGMRQDIGSQSQA